jgi:hypothetical protein
MTALRRHQILSKETPVPQELSTAALPPVTAVSISKLPDQATNLTLHSSVVLKLRSLQRKDHLLQQ